MPPQLPPLRPLPDGGARQALHQEVSAHNVTHKNLQAETQRRLTAEYIMFIERYRFMECSVAYSQCQEMLQNAHLERSRLQEEAQHAQHALQTMKLENRNTTNLNLIRAKDRQIRILKSKLSKYEGHLKPINEEDQYSRDEYVDEDYIRVYHLEDPAYLNIQVAEPGVLERNEETVLFKYEERNGLLMF
ncbi:MAG: hypothetical protein M1812_005851 [Candelaria pacifica]|nr:MAG: hypothetical protein M1812_005851 [Candelaria pacifica]